jgi:hypothetical protein
MNAETRMREIAERLVDTPLWRSLMPERQAIACEVCMRQAFTWQEVARV